MDSKAFSLPSTEARVPHQLCVSNVPIFNHLQPEEMIEISKTTQPIVLTKGELLYRAGDLSSSLYIIHTGRLKIYRLTENGKEQLIRILMPGDFTGELALFTETINDVYAESLERTEICSIQRTSLQRLLVKYPNISLKILKEFSIRLEQAEHQMTSFATEEAETRIGLYLFHLAENTDTSFIHLPMSRKDLASYLGTTPETVSRKLAIFEYEGWINQRNQRDIEILDLEALQHT